MSDFASNHISQEEPDYTEEDLQAMQEFVDEMTRIHDNPLFAEEVDEIEQEV